MFSALIAAALLTGGAPVASVAQEVRSVVAIEVAAGEGTGFFLDDSTIATAAHVVGDADVVRVRPESGGVLTGTVERVAADLDLALVKLDQPATGVRSLPLREEPAEVGEAVYAVGYSLGPATPSVSRGIVSAIRDVNGAEMVQTDAAVNPGNSGGPLLDEEGNVVGLVVSKLEDVDNVGLAVPAAVVEKFRSGPAPAVAPATIAPVTAPADERSATPTVAVGATLVALSAWVAAQRRRSAPRDTVAITLGAARPVSSEDPRNVSLKKASV